MRVAIAPTVSNRIATAGKKNARANASPIQNINAAGTDMKLATAMGRCKMGNLVMMCTSGFEWAAACLGFRSSLSTVAAIGRNTKRTRCSETAQILVQGGVNVCSTSTH